MGPGNCSGFWVGRDAGRPCWYERPLPTKIANGLSCLTFKIQDCHVGYASSQ